MASPTPKQATPEHRRLCPTRSGGTQSLIAQSITVATCFERQRANYHKCFTCAYRGLDSNAELPAPARMTHGEGEETPPPAPAKPAPAKPARKKAAKPA